MAVRMSWVRWSRLSRTRTADWSILFKCPPLRVHDLKVLVDRKVVSPIGARVKEWLILRVVWKGTNNC